MQRADGERSRLGLLARASALARPDVLLGLALVLALDRFVRLSEWSLWLDEAFTLADALGTRPGANPLGYALFGWFYGLTGGRPGELELRLPAAVLGWLGIPLTYWAFRPAAGRRAAAIAALVVAASSWHLYWSQTARFYTLAQDLGLLGTGWVLRGLLSHRPVVAVLGLVAAAAGAAAHPSAAIIVPALCLGAVASGLVAGPQARRARIWLVGAAAVLIAVGAPVLVRALAQWDVVKGQGDPIHLLLTVGFHWSPNLAVGALVGGGFALARGGRFERLSLVVVLLGAASAVVLALFVRVTAQYTFVLLPWLAALAAAPFAGESAGSPGQGPDRRRTELALALGYVGLLVLPSLTSSALYLTHRQGERPQWRAAYEHVFDQAEPGDLVLGMDAPVGEYYLSPRSVELRQPREVVWLDSWRADVARTWERYGRRTWFVVNLEQLEDWPERADREALLEILRRECQLSGAWPLYVESRDLSVWVYVREPVSR